MGDPESTKAKLIEVAIDLFATKGFFGSSIRDIAREMDMSIASIYHYFGSKEGLLLAILEHSAKGLVSELKIIAAKEMEPLAKFKLLLKNHLLLASQGANAAKIYFLDHEQLTQEGQEINLAIQREVLEVYRKVLGDLAESGLLRTKSVTITAFNIFGVINWFLRWFRPEGSLSTEEVIEEIMSFVMHGMLAPEPALQEKA